MTGLVLWVYGAILAGSACQNAVASALSTGGGNWNRFRQYIRQWLYDGSDRARPCQTQLDVSLCFAPLLKWVLAWWHSGPLALAIDPTLKGDRTTAIVISVVYRSCAIPVAWRIHPATQKGSWMDPIVELLQALAPAVPEEMTVIVLCDRGIASPKLWKQICAQGWHPCMRYAKSITFCADGGKRLPARAFVSRPDTAWIGQGTAFSTPKAKRQCTLLVVWYVEQEEPWVILTDLAPDKVGPSWYALRFWIELGFKALKSLGWKWDKTRRTDPTRVSRHWLVLSVATLLVLAYGTRVEDAQERGIAPGNLRKPPKALAPNHRHSRSRPARTVSVFRKGVNCLRRLMLRGRLWTKVWLLPEPWPEPKPELEITCHVPP
ncbi:MAG: transposase [Chloroflexota bacterium]|nr:transposase [Chloroflexota bacterium]